MSKVLIIGGGAAGMMAGVFAARNHHEVHILEKNEKLGKKVFITGKGRCNLTNNCEVEELMKQLSALGEGDVLFLAGSIPSSMTDDAYQKIMEMLDGKGVRIVVDATRDLLMKVLPYHPFLIKPNNHELGEIFGVELKTRESVVPYAKQLQKKGAQNVLVSMAGEGAVLVAASGEVFEAPAPKGKLINGVGAGDSMVAGFMAGYMEKEDYLHAFHMGIAAGSASAFSENLATREEIASVYEQITK